MKSTSTPRFYTYITNISHVQKNAWLIWSSFALMFKLNTDIYRKVYIYGIYIYILYIYYIYMERDIYRDIDTQIYIYRERDIEIQIYRYIDIDIYSYIYGIHFKLRFFDSIQNVGPSRIRTHDLVLTVHTLYPLGYLAER